MYWEQIYLHKFATVKTCKGGMHDSLLISPVQVVIGTEVYWHGVVTRLLTNSPPTVLCVLLDFPTASKDLAETINNKNKIALLTIIFNRQVERTKPNGCWVKYRLPSGHGALL